MGYREGGQRAADPHHSSLSLVITLHPAGIMSEVETSSSRLRRGAKERHSYGGGAAQAAPRPRTSPSQPSRSPGPLGAGRTPGPSSALFEEVCRYLDISTGIYTIYTISTGPRHHVRGGDLVHAAQAGPRLRHGLPASPQRAADRQPPPAALSHVRRGA